MNYSESLQYLKQLGAEVHSARFDLKNMERICRALGHPEQSFKSILIAGTNGKGSTAAMLYSILLQAGISAGCYTSPHLVCLRERIRCGQDCISEEDFACSLSETRQKIEQLLRDRHLRTPPTFFEVLTASAFTFFARKRIALAVLEVGLGGRLDATNVSCPDATAITGIALDHTQFLGKTLFSIAREKAGILRKEIPVVLGEMNPRILRWIFHRAHQIGAPVKCRKGNRRRYSASDHGALRSDRMASGYPYGLLRPVLVGRHQEGNMAVAILLAESLMETGWPIDPVHVQNGIKHTFWPGRLQWLEGTPRLLLDGAHNEQGIGRLVSYLQCDPGGENQCLVFGAMRDKDLLPMIRALFPCFPRIILTGIGNPRSASAKELLALVPSGLVPRIMIAENLPDALKIAGSTVTGEGRVVVAGSLFLVGEALAQSHFDTTQPLPV